MNFRSALSFHGHLAISEEGIQDYLALIEMRLNGNATIKAGDLPQDDIIQPEETDCDDQTEAPATSDVVAGKIIVMCIHGPLMHYGDDYAYGTQDYANRLRAYADDPSVMGGILDLDTPGGQVEGTETWGAAIQYFALQKPIIGFCEDGKIASAGLWGAVYCTEIWAGNTLCRFGSAGIMASLIDARKALEMGGIKQVIMYAPQSTDKNKTEQDALDGKTGAYIANLKFICDRFLGVVETELSGQLTSNDWKTGKMFFAEEAQRIGLINGIKTRDEVIARVQELSIQYNQSNNMLKRFPKVAALKGAAAITAENIEAANLELEEYGVTGMTLIPDTELQALENSSELAAQVTGLQTQLAALGTEITGYKTTISGHAAAIQAKDAEIAKLQAKLTGKPAEDPTGHKAADDKITPSPDAVVEASFETSVDRELAKMHAMIKEAY